METEHINLVLSAFAIIGSSVGFWAWLQSRNVRKNALTRLMMGIAHEQIITKGLFYVNRGYITSEEYSSLVKYTYEPYIQLGGNGLAERVYESVKELPLRTHHPKLDELS